MYECRNLNFGFVILSPEHNIGSVSGTVRSIRNNYSNASITCAVGQDTTPAEMKELKEILPSVWRGKDTITSLINTGMKRGHKEWNVLVMEGVWVRRSVDKHYFTFLKDEKDIIFPIVADYNREGMPTKVYKDFETCTLNGILIHQETFKEVGDIPSYEDINKAKFIWGLMAQEKGCRFKAILGAKI